MFGRQELLKLWCQFRCVFGFSLLPKENVFFFLIGTAEDIRVWSSCSWKRPSYRLKSLSFKGGDKTSSSSALQSKNGLCIHYRLRRIWVRLLILNQNKKEPIEGTTHKHIFPRVNEAGWVGHIHFVDARRQSQCGGHRFWPGPILVTRNCFCLDDQFWLTVIGPPTLYVLGPQTLYLSDIRNTQ